MSSAPAGSPYRAEPASPQAPLATEPRPLLEQGIYVATAPRGQLEREIDLLGARSVRNARLAGLLSWATWLGIIVLGLLAIGPLRRHDSVLGSVLLVALALVVVVGFGLRTIARRRVFRRYEAAETLRVIRGLELDPDAPVQVRIDLFGRKLARSSSRSGGSGARTKTDRWFELACTLVDGTGLELRRVDERTERWHSHARSVAGHGQVRTDYTTHTEQSASTRQVLRLRPAAPLLEQLVALGDRLAGLVAERLGLRGRVQLLGLTNGVLDLSVEGPVDALALIEAVYQAASAPIVVAHPSPATDLVIPWRLLEPTLPNLWGELDRRGKRLAMATLVLVLGAVGAGFGASVVMGWAQWDEQHAELCERDLRRELEQCASRASRATLCSSAAERSKREDACRRDRDDAASYVGAIMGWWTAAAVLLALAAVLLALAFRRPGAAGPTATPRPA
jgi:hypothetical protein